jgi:hypothetical protein
MSTPSYDPYAALPFVGYRRPGSSQLETYVSLMHFVESEKFRGVDESYRQYLLTINDPEDFLFETAGVSQGIRRADWDSIKVAMIRAGMWMQLVQQQAELKDSLLQPGCTTPIELITHVAELTYTRLVNANHVEGEQLRRVVLAGDCALNDQGVFTLFDQIFVNRKPDEIYVAAESGLSVLAEEYCIQHYIPIRVFELAGTTPELTAAEALLKGTHVFSIGQTDQSDSAFARCVMEMAANCDKPAHSIIWPT